MLSVFRWQLQQLLPPDPGADAGPHPHPHHLDLLLPPPAAPHGGCPPRPGGRLRARRKRSSARLRWSSCLACNIQPLPGGPPPASALLSKPHGGAVVQPLSPSSNESQSPQISCGQPSVSAVSGGGAAAGVFASRGRADGNDDDNNVDDDSDNDGDKNLGCERYRVNKKMKVRLGGKGPEHWPPLHIQTTSGFCRETGTPVYFLHSKLNRLYSTQIDWCTEGAAIHC